MKECLAVRCIAYRSQWEIFVVELVDALLVIRPKPSAAVPSPVA